MKQHTASRVSRGSSAATASPSLSAPCDSASAHDSSRAAGRWAMSSGSIATMNERSGASSAAASSRFATLPPETIAALAPLWVRMWRWSAAVLLVKVGTVMAPSVMMAMSAISHSGRFSATSTTRSPAAMPRACSPRASWPTFSAVWRQLSGR